MSRCPSCQRRLLRGNPCPNDGRTSPEEASSTPPPGTPPELTSFRVSGLLGVGGMGAVWRATHEGDDLQVAIKVCHSQDAATLLRFRAESEVMTDIGPPHVPQIHASGVLADGRAFFAMDCLVGRTLSDEIGGWPSPPSLVRIREIGEALLSSAEAMHARNVVHRDLKPDNVFLSSGARLQAKLMDFGVFRRGAVEIDGGTGAGLVVGTPEYMAPEQISSRTDINEAADVYSLGLLLYEISTLRLPFSGEKHDLEYGHLNLRPPLPSTFADVPKPLEDLILKCLAKDPTRRFRTAGELRRAFIDAMDQALLSAAPARVESPAKTAAAPRTLDKQKVVLLFFCITETRGPEVQSALKSFGGHLAHAAGSQCVCIFTHQAGEHPGRRALVAARAMVDRGLTARVIIDVAAVSVRQRPDGSPRFLSSLFTKEQHYPRPEDPAGVLLTLAAKEILPDLPSSPVPGREACFVAGREVEKHGRTISSMTMQHGTQVPICGRAQTLEHLLEQAQGTVSAKRPRVATVLSEAGLGKTRLALELAERLRGGGESYVLELLARDPTGRDTDELLADLLRRSLKLPEGKPADGKHLLVERLGELGEVVYPGVALALGWLSIEQVTELAPRAAPGVLRANASRAAAQALQLLARQQPLFVLLDDAHWADDAVLEALERATVGEVPLWVCAFARPSFESARPSWGQRATHHHREPLDPLTPEAAAELCRSLLRPATQIPDSAVSRLVERTEGIPALLLDLVLGLKRDGLVCKPPAGGGWYLATEVLDRLPDLPVMEWITQREVETLPSDLAAHARLAALLAGDFTVDEFEGILAMDGNVSSAFPLDARVGLNRLLSTRVIVRHRNDRLGFRNALMRETIARSVPEQLRQQIHLAAGAYYRASKIPDALRLPRLAFHASKAGARAEAAGAFLAAAEGARARHNYLESELHYTRSLEQFEENDATASHRLTAFKGRGIMRYRLGRYDDSLADFGRARELAHALKDAASEADILLDEAMALDWLEEWRQSKVLAEKAKELTALLNSPLLQARVIQALGRSALRFSQNEEAIRLLREASSQAEALGSLGYEVLVTSDLMLGFALPLFGIGEEAAERLERVRVLCESQGDELHLGGMYGNRACLWIMLNDPDRFSADSKEVVSLARRSGNLHLERNTHFNASYFFYWRGEYDKAEPHARECIEIDERRFRLGFRPEAAVLLARILWAKGDESGARALVDQTKQQQAKYRTEGKTEVLLAPNDEMLLDVAGLIVAGGTDAEWESLMARAREVAQGQELIEVLELRGLIAKRQSDLATARRYWQEALAAGEKIPNVMNERIRGRLNDLI